MAVYEIARHRYFNRLQRGQSMTEFIIVLPVLVLIIFGAVQFGFIYSAKTTLNYATFQAARLGAVNNASYESLRRGLVGGLAPLYTHSADPGAMDRANERAAAEVDDFIRITRISPLASHFAAAAFGEYDDEEKQWYIPNDNLMYRDPSRLVDGAAIQDANLLKIRVEYCYPLMVPLVSRMVGKISELSKNTSPPRFAQTSQAAVTATNYSEVCGSRANSYKGFVIMSEAVVRMQSPAYRAETECGSEMVCQ